MLTVIVECFLPNDYYQLMFGAIVDQNVFNELLSSKIPRLSQHFQKCGFDPSMVTLQWFTCLFSYNFNNEVLIRLWDVLFFKGDKILFRVALAIFYLL